jgi:hypothetical protein
LAKIRVSIYCPEVKRMVQLTIKGIVNGLVISGNVEDCSVVSCQRADSGFCRLGKTIMVRVD